MVFVIDGNNSSLLDESDGREMESGQVVGRTVQPNKLLYKRYKLKWSVLEWPEKKRLRLAH